MSKALRATFERYLTHSEMNLGCIEKNILNRKGQLNSFYTSKEVIIGVWL